MTKLSHIPMQIQKWIASLTHLFFLILGLTGICLMYIHGNFVDCAILMNSQTWVASGHLGGFSDPLMDCKSCKERFRADKLIEDYMAEHNIEIEGSVDGWSQEQMKQYIDDNNI